MRRGFSEADVEKIACRNALRVMRAVEATGEKLRKVRKPAVGRLEDYPGA
jgi:membrane dipeptidase